MNGGRQERGQSVSPAGQDEWSDDRWRSNEWPAVGATTGSDDGDGIKLYSAVE